MVELGMTGGSGPIARDQLIQGIGSAWPYLGSFGLSGSGRNQRYNNVPLDKANGTAFSILSSLREQNNIPSLSWAYTAGAPYRQPASYGSLTLGGYDRSRLQKKRLPGATFAFNGLLNRELRVTLRSISSSDNPDTQLLLPTPHNTFLDSGIPHLWLPLESCQAFQKTFNLIYNDSANMYSIPDDTHAQNLQRNVSVTFDLRDTNNEKAQNVSIAFPYASFALADKSGKAGNTTRYFPIRVANDPSEYTLGRVFFQEAYVIANYEHKNFSVSQVAFPEDNKQQQEDLVTLPPLEHESDTGKGGISTPVIAAIAATTSVVIAVVIAGFWWWWRRKNREIVDTRRDRNSKHGHDGNVKGRKGGKVELEGDGFVEADDGSPTRVPPYELDGKRSRVFELNAVDAYELKGDTVVRISRIEKDGKAVGKRWWR